MHHESPHQPPRLAHHVGRVCGLLWVAMWLSGDAQADPSLTAGSCDRGAYKVALDAGHGPTRGGATSARGRPEYAFNTRLAQEALEALHQAGFSSSFLINPDDKELGLTERTTRSAAAGANLFISIHHDSVQEHFLESWTHEGHARLHCDRYSGYSLFVNQSSPYAKDSRALAEHLARALKAAGRVPTLHHAEDIEGERRELLDPELGLYRYDGLAVLRTAQSPSLLFEAGVILHREEEARLDQPEHRATLVSALVTAIEEMCTQAAETTQ